MAKLNSGTRIYGTATVDSTLGVTGATTLSSNLTVSGNTTLGASAKTISTTGLLAHTGRATISTNLSVSGNTTVSGTMTATGIVSGSELTSTNASGDEGGQINLAKPPNATTLGGVTIDAYQNKLRIFEQGGTARGVYIDLTAAAAGVGTNLLTGGSSTTQYLQVANAVAIYQTKAVERAALANTNTFIATKLSSSNPATSGLLAHTGRATISTNLSVSGNTVIGKLVANGSLGSSGLVLKSNGSTVYWGQISPTAVVSSLTQNDVVYTTSDYRLKENVVKMVGGLNNVMKLNPVEYTWKDNGSSGQGFLAHELQSVVPDSVIGKKDEVYIEKYEISPHIPATYDERGNPLTPEVDAVFGEREIPKYQSIDKSFLVAILTSAIQEQQTIIESLTNRISALERK